MIRRKNLFIILISIFLFVTLLQFLFFFSFLPKVLNNKVLQNRFISFIEQQTNLKFEYQFLKIKTNYDFSLGLNILSLSVLDDREQILKSQNLEIEIRPLNLLLSQLSLKRIKAKDVVSYVKMDRNGNLELLKYFTRSKYNLKIKFDNTLLDLENVDLYFSDLKNKREVLFRFENIKYIKSQLRKRMELVLRGHILDKCVKSIVDVRILSKIPLKRVISEGCEKFIISGLVKEFDVSLLSPYISNYFPQILELKGILNLSIDNCNRYHRINIDTMNFKILMKDRLNSIEFISGKKTFLKMDLKFGKGDVIIVENFLVKNSKIDIAGNAILKNIFSKFNKRVDINMDFRDSQIHDIINFLPYHLKGKRFEEIRQLKKYGFFGILNGSFHVKGNVDNPDIVGKARIDDAYVVRSFENIRKSLILLDFKGQKLDIEAKVFDSCDQFVKIKGKVNIYKENFGLYEISSSPRVDLNTAMFTLIPIKYILGFKLGPLPKMTLDGFGNIKLIVSGTKSDPLLNGQFNFYNTDATYKGLFLKLYDSFGFLKFENRKIYFKTTQAKALLSPIDIECRTNTYGDVDLNAISDNVDIKKLVEVLRNSEELAKKAKQIAPIEDINGMTKFKLRLKGTIKKDEDIDFLNDFEYFIDLNLNNINLKLKEIKGIISNLCGPIKIYKDDILCNLCGKVGTTRFNLSSDINVDKNNMKFDFSLNDNRIDISDFVDFISVKDSLKQDIKEVVKKISSNMSLRVYYSGRLDKIEPEKLEGLVNFSSPNEVNILKIFSGNFILKNGNLKISDFKIGSKDSYIIVSKDIKNVFDDRKRAINLKLKSENFDLKILNRFKLFKVKIFGLQRIFTVYKSFDGLANFDLNIIKDKIIGDINLNNVSLFHTNLKLPIKVKSGDIKIYNNKIFMKSFIGQIANCDFYSNGKILNFNNNPHFNVYFTMKLTDAFIDNQYNANFLYPIKLKGDVTLSALIDGNTNMVKVRPSLKLQRGADISYMGANLGDEDSIKREIKADIDITENRISVRNFRYLKYLSNEFEDFSEKLFEARANFIKDKSKRFELRNFSAQTFKPISVKLLNVIFRKSLLKDGQFTCNINSIFKNNKPIMLAGVFNIEDAKLPLYNAQIDKINLNLNKIDSKLKAQGVFLDSQVDLECDVSGFNFKTINLENLNINVDRLDVNRMMDFLSGVSDSSRVQKLGLLSKTSSSVVGSESLFTNFDISDLNIKESLIKADSIILNGVLAQDFFAKIDLNGKEGILKIDDIKFLAAQGNILGSLRYNFNTSKLNVDLDASNVAANEASKAIFEIENQIYGNLNGHISLTTNGINDKQRLRNLNGVVAFDVNDGRMPKLGTLEYLLKASNIIKGGITSLTINKLIDILIPPPVANSGFSTIKGHFSVINGVASNIEIFSRGRNLSLFIKGKYDLNTDNAKMEVLGKLVADNDKLTSKIGNLSINSLFLLIPALNFEDSEGILKDINKIPGIEILPNNYRLFKAIIDGDINSSSNFVKSFEWVRY